MVASLSASLLLLLPPQIFFLAFISDGPSAFIPRRLVASGSSRGRTAAPHAGWRWRDRSAGATAANETGSAPCGVERQANHSGWASSPFAPGIASSLAGWTARKELSLGGRRGATSSWCVSVVLLAVIHAAQTKPAGSFKNKHLSNLNPVHPRTSPGRHATRCFSFTCCLALISTLVLEVRGSDIPSPYWLPGWLWADVKWQTSTLGCN